MASLWHEMNVIGGVVKIYGWMIGGGNDRYALLKKRCENKAFEKDKLPVFVPELCAG